METYNKTAQDSPVIWRTQILTPKPKSQIDAQHQPGWLAMVATILRLHKVATNRMQAK
jgi:hypothetical protein